MKKISLKSICFTVFGLVLSVNISAQQATATISQSSDIDKLLQYKKSIDTHSLYKIQIFSGERSAAESSKAKFTRDFPDYSISMEYQTPNYKIWVGDFRTRMEADRALIIVKKNYSSAFIFAPKR